MMVMKMMRMRMILLGVGGWSSSLRRWLEIGRRRLTPSHPSGRLQKTVPDHHCSQNHPYHHHHQCFLSVAIVWNTLKRCFYPDPDRCDHLRALVRGIGNSVFGNVHVLNSSFIFLSGDRTTIFITSGIWSKKIEIAIKWTEMGNTKVFWSKRCQI